MLALDTKRNLNIVIDRLAILERVEWDPASAVVDLHFRFSLENESIDPLDENWDWLSFYIFRLTGVDRIFVAPDKENIPPELKNGHPSQELMAFLLRTFEDQAIYEWTTFDNPATRFTGNWSFGWEFQRRQVSADLDFACVFKERGKFPHSSACWVAGFWFQELEILPNLRDREVVPVDVFLSRYHPFAAKIQP